MLEKNYLLDDANLNPTSTTWNNKTWEKGQQNFQDQLNDMEDRIEMAAAGFRPNPEDFPTEESQIGDLKTLKLPIESWEHKQFYRISGGDPAVETDMSTYASRASNKYLVPSNMEMAVRYALGHYQNQYDTSEHTAEFDTAEKTTACRAIGAQLKVEIRDLA